MDEERSTLQQTEAAAADDQQEFDSLVQSVPEAPHVQEPAAPAKSEVKKPVTAAPVQPKSEVKKKKKKKKKRKKRRKSAARIIGNIIRTIFLVAFLLCIAAVGLAIYLFLGMNTDTLQTDSVSKIIKSEGIPVAERFEIDANARTASIRMDNADIWYLIDSEYGEDYVDELKDKFNEKGFRLSAYGLFIDEYDPSLDLDIRWNGIKIATHLPSDITFEDGTLTITPTGVRIAKIHITPKLLKFFTKIDLADYVLSVDIGPMGIIKSFDDMEIEDEYLVFDVTLDPEFLKPLSNEGNCPENIGWYCDGYTEVLKAGMDYSSDPKAALTAMLKPAEKKPAELERLLNEFYTLADTSDTAKDFKANNGFMFGRILFGNTKEGYEEAHENIVAYCDERNAMVDDLVRGVASSWDAGKISINGESRFVYKKDYLNIRNFATENNPWDNYELFVPAEGFKYALIDSESAYTAKTPKLSKLINKNAVFSVEELDKNVPYGIALIFETSRGYKLMSYVSFTTDADGNIPEEGGIFCLTRALDDELYNSLTAEGAVNVFSDRPAPEAAAE